MFVSDGIVIDTSEHGLVGHWPFNGDVLDESPFGNDGTIEGNTGFVQGPGAGSSALFFDGVDDSVNLGGASSLNPGYKDFTVMAWIKMDPGAGVDRSIFAKQFTEIDRGWNFNIDGDTQPGGIELNVEDGNAIKITGQTDLRDAADDRFPDNPERRDRFITRAISDDCPFTVNAMFHSMGNYLYKHLLKSSASDGNVLLLDNVVLAAADTNNEGHREWVDKIKCRRRVYVTINEDDIALRASRLKAGEEQKARLGHYRFRLDADQAVYVQFSDAPHVGDSHAYFEGRPVRGNPKIKRFFEDALNGKRAEDRLKYDDATNMYHFRRGSRSRR